MTDQFLTAQQLDAQPDLLTIKDAEAFLKKKISASLLYQLCQERRIPHLRLGGESRRGKILIHRRDLLRFLNQNRIGPHPLLDADSE